jgi:hypothetical protein
LALAKTTESKTNEQAAAAAKALASVRKLEKTLYLKGGDAELKGWQLILSVKRKHLGPLNVEMLAGNSQAFQAALLAGSTYILV